MQMYIICSLYYYYSFYYCTHTYIYILCGMATYACAVCNMLWHWCDNRDSRWWQPLAPTSSPGAMTGGLRRIRTASSASCQAERHKCSQLAMIPQFFPGSWPRGISIKYIIISILKYFKVSTTVIMIEELGQFDRIRPSQKRNSHHLPISSYCLSVTPLVGHTVCGTLIDHPYCEPSQWCSAWDLSGLTDAWILATAKVWMLKEGPLCSYSDSWHSMTAVCSIPRASDFMRGVPWTFTLSAQLKSISSMATHASGMLQRVFASIHRS